MRPDRFLQLLTATARTIPGVTRAEPVAEDGKHKRPYLLAIEAGGKTTRWQVAAVSAPGDQYDKPEREPTTGARVIAGEVPALTAASDLDAVTDALVRAVLATDVGEIAAVDLYSRRATPPAIPHGATILFHDGSKILLNHVR